MGLGRCRADGVVGDLIAGVVVVVSSIAGLYDAASVALRMGGRACCCGSEERYQESRCEVVVRVRVMINVM